MLKRPCDPILRTPNVNVVFTELMSIL